MEFEFMAVGVEEVKGIGADGFLPTLRACADEPVAEDGQLRGEDVQRDVRVFGQRGVSGVRIMDKGQPECAGFQVGGSWPALAHGKSQQAGVKGDRPFEVAHGQSQMVKAKDHADLFGGCSLRG